MNKKIAILVTLIMLLSVASLGCIEEQEEVIPEPHVPEEPPEEPVEEPEIEILRLATTTSLYDTGLLGSLEPVFEERYNADLHIISAGTGRAIRHGRDGDVDVLLVHARAREDAFVEAGYGVNRRCIAYNFFLIIGPEADPAGIKGMAPSEAFLKLMEEGMNRPDEVRFVSRGDDSGTHFREIGIWEVAEKNYTIDVRGSGAWYVEAGAGMGATLRMANEKSAYTLVDIGTFLAFAGEIDLVPHVEEGEGLFNPYGVIAISPAVHPAVNFDMANNFINFLKAEDIQIMIGEFGYAEHGRPLFFPLARDCERKGCPTWELCKTPAS